MAAQMPRYFAAAGAAMTQQHQKHLDNELIGDLTLEAGTLRVTHQLVAALELQRAHAGIDREVHVELLQPFALHLAVAA